MDVYGLGAPPARVDRPTETASRWIHTARFDLLCFTLSPLVALPVLIVSPDPSLLSLAVGCLLGIPHYLSTFVFFFWDETRSYHRAHWALFFGGPVLIAAALVCAVLFRLPFIIQVVVYVWNTYHVARQSCGILSIYRHRAGVKDTAIRSIANAAIVSTAFALAFWDTSGHPTLHRFMTLVWPGLPRAVWIAATTAAAVSLLRLALSLAARFRSEQRPRVPELAFLATSLLLFHPYLWIRDSNQATLGMLLGHFIQYLGIVWFVHRLKFAGAVERISQPWLARLSTSLPLLLAVMLATGAISLALRLMPVVPIQAMYTGMLLALVLVHFYLDGLFWAFRRREVRQSLGPYLMAMRTERTAG
jgi:hypothetical protein